MKSTDVPRELREFAKVFDKLEYRHDTASVFHDYMDYCIEVFDLNRTGERRERLQRTYGEQYNLFPELFRLHVTTMNEMLAVQGWYDLPGTFYECISSRSKSSALGQFFTPAPVCDFMASINGADDCPPGKTVNDPACGSGRTLLAWHVKTPGSYLYGDDIDPICTKMTAVNFCLHGVMGQACNMDTLKMEWRFGYQINEYLNPFGMVGLRVITEDQSRYDRWWRSGRDQQANEVVEVESSSAPEIMPSVEITIGKNGQLDFSDLFKC
jgi:type I restriction enzyme M protein